VEALQAGIDLGLTHIDTAEMYGNGRAGELPRGLRSSRARTRFNISLIRSSLAE
jgi:aryl-alcohol dehydrogenase-like predicted oxidoreductase